MPKLLWVALPLVADAQSRVSPGLREPLVLAR